jgi:hypothetical protein
MIRSSIAISDLVDYLNELAAIDPKAMRSLLLTAFECNEDLGKHLNFRASKGPDGRSALGLASLLNSLFGDDENGDPALDIQVGRRKVVFTFNGVPADPEKLAKMRAEHRTKGLDGWEYTPDEKRVVNYLAEVLPSAGSGADPIGFLIASHAAVSMRGSS